MVTSTALVVAAADEEVTKHQDCKCYREQSLVSLLTVVQQPWKGQQIAPLPQATLVASWEMFALVEVAEHHSG